MKRDIRNDYDLQRYFEEYGRGEQFSPYGFKALFEYLEQYEEETGESITVDPVGLSCDYTEYDSATEAVTELLGNVTVWWHGSRFITEEEALDVLERNKLVIRVRDYIETAGDRVIVGQW